MFFFNLKHTVRALNTTKKGAEKRSSSAQSKFHYITRTQSFQNYKEHELESIEFVKSGNMPKFAEDQPSKFWEAADCYERKNGRVCSSFVVALPKELTIEQRIELAEQFISEFADRYQFPFSCAVHNHGGAFSDVEQPHLHFMYSERAIDGIERSPQQFFKRYNEKAPEKGGANKLTADKLDMGRDQVQIFRYKAEELINESLQRHAPTKIVRINDLDIEVTNVVSCLSNKDYNKEHGTELEDIPMMPDRIRFAKEDRDPQLFAEREIMLVEIQRVRKENEYKLYQSYYEAELSRLWELEQENKAPDQGYDGPGF